MTPLAASSPNDPPPRAEDSSATNSIGTRRYWILVSLALIVGASIAVDTYPAVVNDSIAYLSHSQNLSEFGLINLGYRQVGYPLWLAFWHNVGALVEPFALTSIAQRLFLLIATAFAVWKVKGAGWLLVGLLFVPTYVAYSNLMMTESLGIPLAIIAGVLIATLLKPQEQTSQGESALPTWIPIVVAVVAFSLAMVRFHYIIVAGVLLGALLLSAWRRAPSRRPVVISVLISTLLIGMGFLLMSLENNDEFGRFFPSVRGERSQFWMLWQIVVEPNRELFQSELPDIFLDGNPYTFIHQTDILSYEQERKTYSEATELVLATGGTSIWDVRIGAALGVLSGGRIDDNLVNGMEKDVLPGEIERRIHRNYYSREYGVDGFNLAFNEGRVTRPGLISSGPIPQAPMPPVADIFNWLVPISAVVLVGGLFSRRSRTTAIAGITVLAGYALLAGWFAVDFFRFLLPAYLVVVALTGAVVGELIGGWRHGNDEELV